MSKWDKLAGKAVINKTIENLKANGFNVQYVEDGQAAKEKALELIPSGVEIFNATSITLDTIGLPQEINESDKYNAVRPKLMKMDKATQGLEMKKLGAAPEWVIGSVHAITEDGKVLVASQSGSQLPSYAYGASHVIWVVGAQKIVKNLDEGFKRIYEHCLPLEAERARKAYGAPGSSVNKILIFNKESVPNRVTVLLVNEKLGF